MKESAIHFHPSPQAAEPARRKVYDQDQIVKSCTRIESGLRLGYDGVRSCCFGILVAPIFWTASQANGTKISHDEIIEKRRQLFDELNSGPSDLVCNRCSKVELKNTLTSASTNLDSSTWPITQAATCDARIAASRRMTISDPESMTRSRSSANSPRIW